MYSMIKFIEENNIWSNENDEQSQNTNFSQQTILIPYDLEYLVKLIHKMRLSNYQISLFKNILLEQF